MYLDIDQIYPGGLDCLEIKKPTTHNIQTYSLIFNK